VVPRAQGNTVSEIKACVEGKLEYKEALEAALSDSRTQGSKPLLTKHATGHERQPVFHILTSLI
jgi:hypothetical protein